jgi:hypothetical protein
MLLIFKKLLGLDFEGSGTSSGPAQALPLNANPRSEVDQAGTGDDNNR